MSTYTHTLTEIETACGVTLEDVARELARGLMRAGMFYVAEDAAPALASSVARAAFGGRTVEYVGRTLLGRAYQAAPFC